MSRSEAKDRILRAVVRTLSTEGYARTTARAIARAGGFAPGVIYYHFGDLDDLFAATVRFTSRARMARYRDRTEGVRGAVELVRRLRELYAEDGAEGHIAAVQELVAAASGSAALASEIRAETVAWQDFAEEVIRGLIGTSPWVAMVPVREVATAVVATYLGVEMLSHLDRPSNMERPSNVEQPSSVDVARPGVALVSPEALFAAAERAAVFFDLLSPR